jgi:O-antigen/teichoic acid export membrane protein
LRAANKVVLNTGILYGRMLLTVGISLYSTRLILNALGATDFGIFQLVAGVIAMLSFLNNAMATSTQRFLSFYQGENDMVMQKKVFTNSLQIHIIIGLILVLVLELLGFFLFDGFLNIPLDKISVAKAIYHLMSATVFFTVLSVPFMGTLIAHENLLWVSIVSIIETLLKLGIALLLLTLLNNKLLIYGLLTECICLLSLILYAGFCFKKYSECTLDGLFIIDKVQMKQLSSFAGWNLFGALCSLGRTQGLAILLNIFLGTVVNAAYGIANQVSSQMAFFSSSLLRALNPQIMKSEGAGDRDRMLRLSMMACKFCFFLLAIVSIPCIFEMESILKIWLKNVPEHTLIFCRLILLGILINQLTIGLQSAIQATGKIKMYQTVVGTIILLNLPIAYFLLKYNYPVHYVLLSYCSIELIACVARLYFLKIVAELSPRLYFKRVFISLIIPVLVSIITCIIVYNYISSSYRVIYTIFYSSIFFIVSIYIGGLCKDEKEIIKNILIKIKNKI